MGDSRSGRWVLEARSGISFSSHDVYLNVAGGLKITEPAADLAAAAALLSSISNVALPKDAVYFGEVSLSGAVRAASMIRWRVIGQRSPCNPTAPMHMPGWQVY